ncbi:hypothetical protein ACL6C3_24395 [Capilliphycus salinus ALCB114379]|uniref:hypothetical protein n=1 Tax=Capilliphycus salinus TaxID=2768948 RepID=UPI0039A6D996
MKISPPKPKGTQPFKGEKHPRPLILAFMLTGVLAIQAYPAFLKTVVESAGVLVSPSSVSVASTSHAVSAQSDSSVPDQPINQIEQSADPIDKTENSVCQPSEACNRPEKPSIYKVLPSPVFERHVHKKTAKTPVELQVKLVNYDLHSQAHPPEQVDSLPSGVAEAVRQELSQQTGVSPEKLTITDVERQTWPNTCLGLAQSDELCGQMLVEGWRVVVSNGRQSWVYRTDLNGRVIRLETNQSVSNLPVSVANTVFQDAANRSGLPHSALRIVEAQSETWPDGCLGLGEPGTLCTLALVPGWQVKIVSGRERWVYRTNESGSLLRLDQQASQFKDSASLRLINITDSQLLSPRTQNWVWQAISFCGITDTTYETLFGKICNDRLEQNSELF